MEHKGKLELTWVGKYDDKVIEPRILVEDREKSYGDPHSENMLIHGDNLIALQALQQDFAGKIKCIYIDPPFNTGQAFENYDDNLEMSIWLSLMRKRIQLLHELLSDDGTMFVHIDDAYLPYITILLDEVFGRHNRLYLITFKQGAATGHKAINPGCVTTTNFIIMVAKDKALWKPNRVYTKKTARDTRYTKFITNIQDPFSEWNIVTLAEAYASAKGLSLSDARKEIKENPKLMDDFVISNAASVIRTARPDMKSVGKDIQEKIKESLEDSTNIYYLHRENNPDMYFIKGERILFYKDKLREIDGELVTAEPLTTLWDDILSNNLHNEGGVSFPKGKKPEHLIKRVLEIASNEQEWFLDSFLGSGTSIAVAHKMNRKYIGIEMGEQAYTHCKKRLDAIVSGEDSSGITKAVNWQGGGGYHFYELAPSLLVKNERLPIYQINPEYTFEMLCEAICKIEGFKYKPDGVYHGHSSEKRFIHITKEFVNAEYIRSIATTLGEDQSLLVYSTKVQSDLRLPENIEVKRIPKDLLDKCTFESEVR
ncbi:site-specific DNA-methyltransferase [Faecalibacterium sp. An77]|uniref:site-specific DNA-methyltransferase n=1 Tax=Faecalibacterium sp. An77 TaxID=1965655 RepID=UPI000B3A35CB|nr:site-specific DNA-methyltransferase [Faecalibacterium sp. An77]OUN38139.1 site-specific DNA-methyltransferase [Faecalibacterium sp. An77]